MRKFLLLLLPCIFFLKSNAQTIVQVSANPGTSANIILGTLNYHVSEYIYTETEIGAANFTSAGTSINFISFFTNTVGSTTTFTNVKIYLKDVPAGTTTFAAGAYTTVGYTMVYNGSVTVNNTGWFGVALSTPFVRTAGNNLQMLIERTDNATHTGYIFNSANGNNTSSTALTSRRYNDATTAPVSGTTSLATSAFRAAVQFKHATANDVAALAVYTLGKIARPSSNPHVIQASIVNHSVNTLTNVPVTLNITGANTFTNTQTITSLPAGAQSTVTFADFNPTANGVNTITVTATNNSGFDAVVIAYSGTCGALTSIGCVDAGGTGGTETLNLTGLTASTTYYVRVYDYNAAGNEGTFTIKGSGPALPVTLTDFSGYIDGRQNILKWNTATETNNRGFELERSADGERFSVIGTIASKAENGNSVSSLSYNYADAKPLSGNNYYRLKQLDKDGRVTYSSVVMLKSSVKEISFSSVYPNPAKGWLNVIISAPASEKARLVITDLAGRVVMQQSYNLAGGDNKQQLNIGNLPPGNYTVKLICDKGCETAIKRFIKE